MPRDSKLLDLAVSAIDSRSSRRTVLTRVAIGASALAVAPVRYLLRPAPAYAVVCGDCNSNALCCTDNSLTCFCCAITGVNDCPNQTAKCGWWWCSGVAYIDCCGSCGDGKKCCGQNCNNRPHCYLPRDYGNCGAINGCDKWNQFGDLIHCRITRRNADPPACCWGGHSVGSCDTPPTCAQV